MEPEMVIASGPPAVVTDIIDTAQQRLIDSYNKHKAPVPSNSKALAQAFDPSVLLDLALSILTSCFSSIIPSPTPAAAVKTVITKNPILARFQIRRSMRASGYLNRPDANAIIEALMDTGTSSTADEMQDFVATTNAYVV